MSDQTQIPDTILDAVIAWANSSPCAKSKRGVVIFTSTTVAAGGTNQPPPTFACDGSEACRAACSKVCEHAEMAALRMLKGSDTGFELAHIKTVGGVAVPSGGPSCSDCSKAILMDGRIAGVWLMHEEGWQRYTPLDFHERSLKACKLPLIRLSSP